MIGMIDLLLKPLLLGKARKIDKCCRNYVAGKLLDVGAGRCYIARELEKKHGVKATCLDIDNFGRTKIPVIIYNGKDIPFNNDEFNCSIIAYVLHHCDDPIRVLEETIRVTKKNIIVFEDTKLGRMNKIMDFVANKVRGVDTPFNFHTKEEWLEIFKKMNLNVVAIADDVEKEWCYPFVTHTMFVVKK